MADAEMVPQTSVPGSPKDGQTKTVSNEANAEAGANTTDDNHLQVQRKDSMDSEKGPEPSRSAEQYKSRIDNIKLHIQEKQKQNMADTKKKELVFGPAVIWYLAKRYHAVENLSWSQYVRHFLPYPLITIAITGLQLLSLLLIYYDTDEIPKQSDFEDPASRVALVFARLSALSILTAYILMTGRNIQNFIHVIAFDAIIQDIKYFYVYLLLPISQGLVEAIAIYISSVIILTSGTIIDVFKDVVAIMFLLEIDQWMAAALNMMDLGLDADSLVIDFEFDDSNLDELITLIVYGALLFVRFSIIAWAVFNTIYGTFFNAENVN